jgi:predicted permease
MGWASDLRQDLRFARRSLARHRGLSAVIVLTLALAIGANTAIFSLMDTLLLAPLPVRSPQTLMLLRWTTHHSPRFHSASSYGDCNNVFSKLSAGSCSFSLPFFRELQTSARSLRAVTASGGTSEFNLSGHGAASMVSATYVAGNYFSVLGVAPAAGRLLEAADDTPSAPIAVVLSHRFWRRTFAGSRAIVGRSLALNHVPVTVVGVAAPSFTSLTPGRVSDAWLPLSARAKLTPDFRAQSEDAGAIWLVLLGRLRAGTSRAQAQAEVSGMFRRDMLAGPKPKAKPGDGVRVAVESAQAGLSGVRGPYTQPLTILMWAVGAILLIACANVAGLLLGRARARQKELAVRRALGAGGGRIARQLLTESLTLAALGGLLGLVLASWGARALLAAMASAARRPLGLTVHLDMRVLLFALGITLATGLLFGLAPALRGTRGDLNRSLKDAAGNSEGGRSKWLHLGNWLVVAQVALCAVVLAAAGLMVRTLANLRAVDPGFDTSHLLLFQLEPELIGYKGARVNQLYDRLQRHLGALPGVVGVTYSEAPLVSGDLWETTVRITPKGKGVESDMMAVGLNFFSTMRIPLRLGRAFRPTDFVARPETPPGAKVPAGPPVAVIVNETFVQRYLSPGDPIGRVFGRGEDGRSAGYVVVGVSADTKYQNLSAKLAPTMYEPSTDGYANFEVRTAAAPLALLPEVRRAVRAIDPNLPVDQPSTQTENIDQTLFRQRMLAWLSGLLGGLALLLAAIGLYALLAQEVGRRTREIGIRMALGADRGRIRRIVVALGAALTVIGLAAGLAGAWAATRSLGSLLYGVTPADPATAAGVAVVMLGVALAACWLPARRATRVDPLVALREE